VNTETSHAGDLLVRIGAAVFLVGAVATVATVAPLFLGTKPFPAPAYFVCMLMAVGFVIAGCGLLRSMGAQRRASRAAAADGVSRAHGPHDSGAGSGGQLA